MNSGLLGNRMGRCMQLLIPSHHSRPIYFTRLTLYNELKADKGGDEGKKCVQRILGRLLIQQYFSVWCRLGWQPELAMCRKTRRQGR